MSKTVETLIKTVEDEFNVRVFLAHWRPVDVNDTLYTRRELEKNGLSTENWLLKGGFTECKIVERTSPVSSIMPRILVESSASCSPKDNYNRKLGAIIAIGRAVKELRSV